MYNQLDRISGVKGGVYINDTDSHIVTCTGGIQVITECTFTTLTGNIEGSVTTLPVGVYGGKFTVIKLASGNLIAYN